MVVCGGSFVVGAWVLLASVVFVCWDCFCGLYCGYCGLRVFPGVSWCLAVAWFVVVVVWVLGL